MNPLTLFSPATSFKYHIQIEGMIIAEFSSCSGLSAEREIITVREGGINDYEYKLPGRIKYGPLTLKHGITYFHDFWNWFMKGLYTGKVKRRDITIVLMSSLYVPMKYWDVVEAFPSKYIGPEIKSDGNEVAIEGIELVHHGIVINDVMSKL